MTAHPAPNPSAPSSTSPTRADLRLGRTGRNEPRFGCCQRTHFSRPDGRPGNIKDLVKVCRESLPRDRFEISLDNTSAWPETREGDGEEVDTEPRFDELAKLRSQDIAKLTRRTARKPLNVAELISALGDSSAAVDARIPSESSVHVKAKDGKVFKRRWGLAVVTPLGTFILRTPIDEAPLTTADPSHRLFGKEDLQLLKDEPCFVFHRGPDRSIVMKTLFGSSLYADMAPGEEVQVRHMSEALAFAKRRDEMVVFVVERSGKDVNSIVPEGMEAVIGKVFSELTYYSHTVTSDESFTRLPLAEPSAGSSVWAHSLRLAVSREEIPVEVLPQDDEDTRLKLTRLTRLEAKVAARMRAVLLRLEKEHAVIAEETPSAPAFPLVKAEDHRGVRLWLGFSDNYQAIDMIAGVSESLFAKEAEAAVCTSEHVGGGPRGRPSAWKNRNLAEGPPLESPAPTRSRRTPEFREAGFRL
ncbi:hypothetical protein HDU86_000516 [Geranomyces michiganensis]|nr:hypothetical protein HDU86_000516 [Geranomyces michiganensis]